MLLTSVVISFIFVCFISPEIELIVGFMEARETTPFSLGFIFFITAGNEVWGKVIFSEAYVKNSVHRGCLLLGGGHVWSWGWCAPRGYLVPGGCLVPGVSAKGGTVPAPGGCLIPGGVWSWGCVCLRGACSMRGCLVETPPPPMATAVGGTHPSEMHSCFYAVLVVALRQGNHGSATGKTVLVGKCSCDAFKLKFTCTAPHSYSLVTHGLRY